jgi:hypothetical protein
VKRRVWVSGAAVLLVSAAATAAVIVLPGAPASGTTPQPTTAVAPVEKGDLSDLVSTYGTLAFRARSDGSPYTAVNQGRGTYTQLPSTGDLVDCGQVLYRVDDRPVVLLCGPTPAYRSQSMGEHGPDIAELNANLVALGYATKAGLDPSSAGFGPATMAAVKRLQSALKQEPTGSLDLGQVVFLPESARIASVTAALGGSAQRGAQVLSATSDTPEVQVGLDPSQQDAVTKGDGARITLPGNRSVTGKVERLGSVGQAPPGQSDGTQGGTGQGGSGQGGGEATVPVYLTLDRPDLARGYDRAPVQVEITTTGVHDVLSVPVTAIIATTGGGFAVDVVRADSRRDPVAVTLGLVDTSAGRVQVEGDLREGDHVVVPAS